MQRLAALFVAGSWRHVRGEPFAPLSLVDPLVSSKGTVCAVFLFPTRDHIFFPTHFAVVRTTDVADEPELLTQRGQLINFASSNDPAIRAVPSAWATHKSCAAHPACAQQHYWSTTFRQVYHHPKNRYLAEKRLFAASNFGPIHTPTQKTLLNPQPNKG